LCFYYPSFSFLIFFSFYLPSQAPWAARRGLVSLRARARGEVLLQLPLSAAIAPPQRPLWYAPTSEEAFLATLLRRGADHDRSTTALLRRAGSELVPVPPLGQARALSPAFALASAVYWLLRDSRHPLIDAYHSDAAAEAATGLLSLPADATLAAPPPLARPGSAARGLAAWARLAVPAAAPAPTSWSKSPHATDLLRHPMSALDPAQLAVAVARTPESAAADVAAAAAAARARGDTEATLQVPIAKLSYPPGAEPPAPPTTHGPSYTPPPPSSSVHAGAVGRLDAAMGNVAMAAATAFGAAPATVGQPLCAIIFPSAAMAAAAAGADPTATAAAAAAGSTVLGGVGISAAAKSKWSRAAADGAAVAEALSELGVPLPTDAESSAAAAAAATGAGIGSDAVFLARALASPLCPAAGRISVPLAQTAIDTVLSRGIAAGATAVATAALRADEAVAWRIARGVADAQALRRRRGTAAAPADAAAAEDAEDAEDADAVTNEESRVAAAALALLRGAGDPAAGAAGLPGGNPADVSSLLTDSDGRIISASAGSIAVSRDWAQQLTAGTPLLLPYIDMLNHAASAREHNVALTFTVEPLPEAEAAAAAEQGQPQVRVVATVRALRPLAAGEELCLAYHMLQGHDGEAGVTVATAAAAAAAAPAVGAAATSGSAGNVSPALAAAAAAAAAQSPVGVIARELEQERASLREIQDRLEALDAAGTYDAASVVDALQPPSEAGGYDDESLRARLEAAGGEMSLADLLGLELTDEQSGRHLTGADAVARAKEILKETGERMDHARAVVQQRQQQEERERLAEAQQRAAEAGDVAGSAAARSQLHAAEAAGAKTAAGVFVPAGNATPAQQRAAAAAAAGVIDIAREPASAESATLDAEALSGANTPRPDSERIRQFKPFKGGTQRTGTGTGTGNGSGGLTGGPKARFSTLAPRAGLSTAAAVAAAGATGTNTGARVVVGAADVSAVLSRALRQFSSSSSSGSSGGGVGARGPAATVTPNPEGGVTVKGATDVAVSILSPDITPASLASGTAGANVGGPDRFRKGGFKLSSTPQEDIAKLYNLPSAGAGAAAPNSSSSSSNSNSSDGGYFVGGDISQDLYSRSDEHLTHEANQQMSTRELAEELGYHVIDRPSGMDAEMGFDPANSNAILFPVKASESERREILRARQEDDAARADYVRSNPELARQQDELYAAAGALPEQKEAAAATARANAGRGGAAGAGQSKTYAPVGGASSAVPSRVFHGKEAPGVLDAANWFPGAAGAITPPQPRPAAGSNRIITSARDAGPAHTGAGTSTGTVAGTAAGAGTGNGPWPWAGPRPSGGVGALRTNDDVMAAIGADLARPHPLAAGRPALGGQLLDPALQNSVLRGGSSGGGGVHMPAGFDAGARLGQMGSPGLVTGSGVGAGAAPASLNPGMSPQEAQRMLKQAEAAAAAEASWKQVDSAGLLSRYGFALADSPVDAVTVSLAEVAHALTASPAVAAAVAAPGGAVARAPLTGFTWLTPRLHAAAPQRNATSSGNAVVLSPLPIEPPAAIVARKAGKTALDLLSGGSRAAGAAALDAASSSALISLPRLIGEVAQLDALTAVDNTPRTQQHLLSLQTRLVRLAKDEFEGPAALFNLCMASLRELAQHGSRARAVAAATAARAGTAPAPTSDTAFAVPDVELHTACAAVAQLLLEAALTTWGPEQAAPALTALAATATARVVAPGAVEVERVPVTLSEAVLAQCGVALPAGIRARAASLPAGRVSPASALSEAELAALFVRALPPAAEMEEALCAADRAALDVISGAMAARERDIPELRGVAGALTMRLNAKRTWVEHYNTARELAVAAAQVEASAVRIQKGHKVVE
jgi:hypothetical protein